MRVLTIHLNMVLDFELHAWQAGPLFSESTTAYALSNGLNRYAIDGRLYEP